MKKEIKVIIIGSGPGGYTAASRLASLGFGVTIIEKSNTGGTCLNIGCIPTKTLLDHLSTYEEFKDSVEKRKLFKAGDISVIPENLRDYQQQVIHQLTQGLEKLFQKKEITLIKGKARLIALNEIEVMKEDGNVEKFKADHIIIATGSKPKNIPTFELDKKQILTSDDIWNIPIIPKKLLIVGSGPIGIEFARVYRNLGTEVTIAEIKETICPILDLEISENLERSLKKRKIIIRRNFASKMIEKNVSGIKVKFISTKNSQEIEEEFDIALIAVGREPNTNDLGLEQIGIKTERGGFITVDRNLKTNIPNIWAIGDITNFPQLAHTASYQGRIVAENIMGTKKEFTGTTIPACIYGYPEVAFVGLTEKQLQENQIKYKVGKALFLASGKAKASGRTEGLVKVLVDEITEEILGAHIIGAEASCLINELTIAMKNNLKVEDIIHSIHAHPTYSEVILEALEDCIGEAIHA